MLRHIFGEDQNTSKVDDLIDDVLSKMDTTSPDSEEYPKLLSTLERLYKLKAHKRRMPVSPDTLALVAGNLIGILIIGSIEKEHVITSKAFTQLIRPSTSSNEPK